MRKAYLIISESEKKLVDAEEVEYSDYPKIFQCPTCNATLTLRGGHSRNGHRISSTFVHPEGDISDCKERVAFDFPSSSQPVPDFELIKKGQSNKKLEQAFLRCLLHYKSGQLSSTILGKYSPRIPMSISFLKKESLERKIKYNEKPTKVCSDPILLIRASSTILSSDQSQQYIEQEIGKFEEWLETSQQADNYFSEREQEGENQSVDISIKNHCRKLRGIIRYICRGTSKDFRQEFLKIIIWGDQKLPVPLKYLWSDQEMRNLENWGGSWKDNTREIEEKRKPQIELIKKFSTQDLQRICEDPHFLRDSFLAFYQNSSLPNSEFIEFVLSNTLESIKLYDWFVLPEFYF